MDEQQVSVVLLAINKVKEAVDDMRKSVDDLQMNLKEMRKALKSTTAMLKHLGNFENEVPTEDVISSKVSSYASKVNVENVSAVADTSVGRVFPLQPMVTVNPYEHFSYLLDIKVAVIDGNGETCCEPKFGVVKNVLKSRLTPVCENESVNVLLLFVTKMTFFESWCYIPLVIAAKPLAKPPDNRTRLGIIVSILLPQTHAQNEFKGMKCVDVDVSYGLVIILWLGMTPSVEFNILLRSRFKFNKVYGDFEIWNEVQFDCCFQFQWPDEFENAIESSWYKDVSSDRSDYVFSEEFNNSGAIYSSEGFSEFSELSDTIEGPKELMCLFFSHRMSRAASLGTVEYFENPDGLKELRGRSSFTRGLSSSMKIITSNDEYFKLSIIQSENQLRGSKVYPCAPDKESGGHGDLTIHDPKPYDEMTREVCIYSTLIYMDFGFTERATPKIHGWSLAMGDAWLCKPNYKSSHICDHYRIGNMQRIFSVVLLRGEYSELMFQGVFSANVISTLLGVLSKSTTYWLLQIIIKGIVDDKFLLGLTRIHCESLRCGCRQAMKQYHTFTNGLGLLGKCKTLFMPLDEDEEIFQNQADILSTSPAGQGAGSDYYSHQSTSRQLQTRMNSQFRMYWACTRKNFKSSLPLYDIERYTSIENQATQHIIGSINQQPLLHTTRKDFDLKKFLAVSPTYNFNINIMNFPPGAFLNTKVPYDQPRLFFEEGISILVSIEISPFSHISSHVAKTKPPTEVHGSATSSKLQAATGYTYLETKRHNLAVYRLLGTDMELCNKGSGFVAPPGVTIYEELCAIVSLDWTNVKNEMITNSKFKNFLELVIEFKELINDFYSSHYTLCLEHLSNNKSNLVLHMWMLATVFGTTIIGLKKDFKASITDSQSHARIDTNNKIAFKRNVAWIILASTLNWNLEVLMFSLPRPPEVNDLEDKVVFEGRRM